MDDLRIGEEGPGEGRGEVTCRTFRAVGEETLFGDFILWKQGNRKPHDT